MLGALPLLGFAILTERQHADQVATAPQQQVQVTRAPQPSSTANAPQAVPLPFPPRTRQYQAVTRNSPKLGEYCR